MFVCMHACINALPGVALPDYPRQTDRRHSSAARRAYCNFSQGIQIPRLFFFLSLLIAPTRFYGVQPSQLAK